MKSTLLLPVAILMLAAACTSGILGKKVKEPFTGRAYESNNRFFRGTGKGESSQDNIARGKADIEAKAQLASQVQTNVKEVMNTQLADVRKIGEEKYYNEKEKKYTVFMAYEIKKNAMFRFMKKQAKVDTKINDKQREAIEKILDEQIAAADAADKEGDN